MREPSGFHFLLDFGLRGFGQRYGFFLPRPVVFRFGRFSRGRRLDGISQGHRHDECEGVVARFTDRKNLNNLARRFELEAHRARADDREVLAQVACLQADHDGRALVGDVERLLRRTLLVALSFMYEVRAGMYEQLHATRGTIDSYRKAGEIAGTVHSEHPEMAQAMRNSSSSHWFLGLALDREGDYRGAIENFRVSLKTVTEPESVKIDLAHYGEAKYDIVLGRELCKVGEHARGVALIRRGLELTRNYISRDPTRAGSFIFTAELFTWGAEGLSIAGRTDVAASACVEIIGLVEREAQNSPNNPNLQLRLASLDELLGNVYAGYDEGAHALKTSDRARLASAGRWYQKGLDVSGEAVGKYGIATASSQDQMKALREKVSQCEERLNR